MNNTDIHSFTADITTKFEQFNNCEIEISGYTIFGKPGKDLHNNWNWLGSKVFVTGIEVDISEDFDTDEYYDEIMDEVERYISETYYVGMRQHQLPISTKFEKVENIDFEFDKNLEEEIFIGDLFEKYKSEKWFNSEIEIYEEKLPYVHFRMYHLFGRWFD